jgi:hypothetical protein
MDLVNKDMTQKEAAAASSSEAAAASSQASAEASSEAAEAASEKAAEEAAAAAASAKAAALPSNLSQDEQVLGDNEATPGAFYGKGPQTTIDWTKAKAENPDLLGYLVIPGAGLQVPVLNSDDGKGSVYIDAGNSTDLTDPHTVLYGSDSIQHIQDYGDSQYLSGNPYIYLCTSTVTCEYSVFAAYPSEDEKDASLLTSYNCYDVQAFNEYVDQILSMRSLSADIDASQQQNILNAWRMLTIEYVANGERYLVQATYTSEEAQ